jgi:Zn-dependent protease with chaperone function
MMPFALFAWLGFAGITALLCAFLYPLIRSRLWSLPPAMRADHVLAWTVAPAAIGLLLAGFIFLPSVLSLLGIASDHCQAYAADFSYRCLLHPLASMERELPWFLLFPVSTVGLIFLGRVGWELLRVHRLVSVLTRASHLDPSRNIWIVESEWPLALASGIPHARVFISSKLVHSLSPPQLTAVLAHERAHLHRHDPARYFIARIMSCLHVSWLRRKLLEDLSLAVEQSCDEEAAKEVGDRLLVADTIVRVERLLNKQFPSMSALLPSFMGSHVVVRVESLLASPREPVPVHQIMSHVCVGLVVVALMLAAEPLHQLTEAVLGLLLLIG